MPGELASTYLYLKECLVSLHLKTIPQPKPTAILTMNLLTLCLFPLLAAAQLPDLANVTISKVVFSGNGCPRESVSTSISFDRSVITLGFDAFEVYLGPGFTQFDRSKVCTVHIDLSMGNFPAATRLQFAVVGATYHGYANFETPISKAISSSYLFDSIDSIVPKTEVTIPGAGRGVTFTETQAIQEAVQLRSPCGASQIGLSVKERVTLVSEAANAYYDGDENDGDVPLTHQIHLK